jgi:hypothetical protein
MTELGLSIFVISLITIHEFCDDSQVMPSYVWRSFFVAVIMPQDVILNKYRAVLLPRDKIVTYPSIHQYHF